MSPKIKTRNKLSLTTVFGIICLLVSATILVGIFRYPLAEEIRYTSNSLLKETKQEKLTEPVNTDFSIFIGKISANAPIIADVSPFDSAVYQKALTRGVAHAAGTKKPGAGGNIFLFAHSSGDLLTASRFNSVFYLLHHLQTGDLITVWYLGKSYNYQVETKSIVKPNNLTYLAPKEHEVLTLMTCWPPGTSLNRLILTATPVE